MSFKKQKKSFPCCPPTLKFLRSFLFRIYIQSLDVLFQKKSPRIQQTIYCKFAILYRFRISVPVQSKRKVNDLSRNLLQLLMQPLLEFFIQLLFQILFFYWLMFFIHVLEGQEKIKRYSLVVKCRRFNQVLQRQNVLFPFP